MSRRMLRSRLNLRALEDRLTPAISWTGSAGDGQWFTKGNWAGNIVPGPSDDVEINAPNVHVNYNGSGAGSIQSVDLKAGYLDVNSGQLSITNGLTITPGWWVSAQNTGTSLTVTGATQISGAGVYGNGSATVNLNSLTSVAGSPSGNTSLQAHSGSTLSIPNLTSITGTASDYFVHVRAFSGGTVNIPALASVTSGYVEIRADDAGSVMNAGSLATFDIASPLYGNIGAQSGGTINVAAGLSKIGRTNLYVSGNSFPVGQLTTVVDSSIFASVGESKFNAVTTLTGSNIYAENASTVSFGALTSLTGSVNYGTVSSASGGSTLSFPSLTTVNANTSTFTSFQAFGGSKLNIPLVSKIDTGYSELRAQDSGSVLNASSLSTFAFPTGTYGNLYTYNDGKVQLSPTFSAIDRTNVAITDAAALPVAQFTSITNSSVETDSATVALTNVTQLAGSSVYARNSSSVTFGTLTAYSGNTAYSVSLQAESASVLSFPVLTTVTANTSTFTNFRAYSGGTVSVPGVTSISTGYVELRGQDAGSLTDFPALTSLSFPTNTYGSILSYYGGKVHVAAGFTSLNGIDFHIDSAAGFPIGQLTTAKASNIIVEGGQPVFSNLATFEGQNNILQSQGAGTVASFPVLANLKCNSTYFTYLRAYSGSTLTAPALSKIDTGYVELRSQDAGSLLDVPALATMSFPAGTYGSIYTYYGGKIQINAGYTALNTIDFRTDGTNLFPVGQLTSSSLSSIYIDGGAPVFTNLTSFTSQNNVLQSNYGATPSFPALTTLNLSTQYWTYLRAYGGSTLSIPNLSKTDSGYIELRGQDANSVLDLPSLATVTLPTGTYGAIWVYYGGKVNVAPAYTAMTDIEFHTDTPAGFPVGQLKSATRTNLFIDAGTATFTNLATVSQSGHIIQTNGASTVASFPALTTFTGLTNSTNAFRAYGGSKISATALSKIDTGGIELRAQDAGSTLDLPALADVTPPIPAYGYVYNFYGGKINTAPNLHLYNLQLEFDDLAAFNFSNLQVDASATVYGYGKLPGNVTNSGQFDLRYFVAATLEIAGNYVQTPTGKLTIDLAGLTQGTQYDWLDVGGSVQLDGTLSIRYLGGYMPSLGNAFTPVSGASRTGSFANYNNLLIGGGLELVPSYTATAAVLTATLSAGPFVTGFTPTGNQFSAVTYCDVTFNEPIDGATFTTADATVTGPGGPYTPTSIQPVGGNTFRIYLPTLSSVGTYTVTVGPHITDIAGSEMNQDGDGTFGEVPDDAYSANFTVVTADLVVQSIDSMPASAKFGETFNVSYTIRNDGTAAATGLWYDYVFLSTDATFDGGDQYVGYGSGPGLPLNPTATYGGTASVTLPLAPARPDGNYYLIIVADGSNGVPEVNELNNSLAGSAIDMKTPPRVTQLTVNGGSQQRSFVTEVMVTFNEVVNLPTNAADAFTLQRITVPGSNGFVGLTASNVDNSGGQTKVTLTFQSGPLYTGNTLIDGRYELKALASQITDSTGFNLDGNANGVVGDDYASTAVHRLFGDVNGDGYTDLNDFIAFRDANGSDSTTPNWNPYFDINGDGFIDNNDFLAFRQRLGTGV